MAFRNTAIFALQNFTLLQPVFSRGSNEAIGQDGKVTKCVKKCVWRMLSCGSKLLWPTCIFLKIPSFLQMTWVDVTWVLWGVSCCLGVLLILFVDVSLTNFGASEGVQRDEAILSQCIPVMNQEAVCLDGDCSRGFLCLALDGSSGQTVRGWGKVQQLACKNVKSPSWAWLQWLLWDICSVPRWAKPMPPASSWGQGVSIVGTICGRAGMRNPRVRQCWFILLPSLLPPWCWGQELIGCCHENTCKGRGLEGRYQRRWFIPWKVLWVITGWTECWICLVKLLLSISVALWCDFPALVISLVCNHHSLFLGRCDFLWLSGLSPWRGDQFLWN